MDRRFDIPCIGVRYTMGRGHNSMGRGLDIPWIKYDVFANKRNSLQKKKYIMGRGIKIA